MLEKIRRKVRLHEMSGTEIKKFRKFSITFVLYHIAIAWIFTAILFLLLEIVPFITSGGESFSITGYFSLVNAMFPLALFIVLLFAIWDYPFYTRWVVRNTAKKLDKYKFHKDCTWIIKSGIFVDVVNGKTAIISWFHPFKIQIIESGRIKDIEVISNYRASMTTRNHGVKLTFHIDDVDFYIDILIVIKGRRGSLISSSKDDPRFIHAIEEAGNIKKLIEKSAKSFPC